MRKVIFIIVGLATLAGAIFIAISMKSQRSFPQPVTKSVKTGVFVQVVANEAIPVTIETGGNLQAKDRFELFSEVQGIFEYSDNTFKPGSLYRKGQTLLRINADEHKANIRAQKSTLYNQLVQLLPDLKLDYPESFDQWNAYISNFDLESPIQALPEPVNNREKLFLAGRNIYTPLFQYPKCGRKTGKICDQGAIRWCHHRGPGD